MEVRASTRFEKVLQILIKFSPQFLMFPTFRGYTAHLYLDDSVTGNNTNKRYTQLPGFKFKINKTNIFLLPTEYRH